MTTYHCTFRWCAEDWPDNKDEYGNLDFRCQPCITTTISISLTDDVSPWNVYRQAEALAQVPSADGVSSWDGDGITIRFNDEEYDITPHRLTPALTWADLN